MIYAALSTYLSCANASYDEQRFEIRSQQQEKPQEEEAKQQQREREREKNEEEVEVERGRRDLTTKIAGCARP